MIVDVDANEQIQWSWCHCIAYSSLYISFEVESVKAKLDSLVLYSRWNVVHVLPSLQVPLTGTANLQPNSQSHQQCRWILIRYQLTLDPFLYTWVPCPCLDTGWCYQCICLSVYGNEPCKPTRPGRISQCIHRAEKGGSNWAIGDILGKDWQRSLQLSSRPVPIKRSESEGVGVNRRCGIHCKWWMTRSKNTSKEVNLRLSVSGVHGLRKLKGRSRDWPKAPWPLKHPWHFSRTNMNKYLSDW